MYLDHFGLDRPPFKITPDTRLFYTGNKRGATLEALKYAILSGEGMIKVVGEVGSGKTMLCRMLEVELNDDVEIVYIANPSLSPENILHVIAFELQLNITSDSSKLEVMQSLQRYLLEKHADNKQVVVFVEEAQSMPIETLEEIRLLSNLETSEYKLLQMVLFGQPELDDKLRNPAIRQLKERITQNFYLDPFPASDVFHYLNFRMRAVGYRGPDLFTRRVSSLIERKSRGLTRRINILADKALLAVYSDGGHNINSRHINLAARDSDFGYDWQWKPWLKGTMAVAAIVCALAIGSLLPGLFQTDNTDFAALTHITPQAGPEAESSSPEQKWPNPHPVSTTPQTSRETVTTEAMKPARNLSHNQANDSQKLHPSTETQSPLLADHSTTDFSSTLLQQRLNATQNWLINASSESFTIQLILLDVWAEDEIEAYLQRSQQYLNMDKLYIYRASIRGRMVYSVLYNEYARRARANQQLQSLPQWFQQGEPYLRTLKGIRYDLRKTHNAISYSELNN